MYILSKLLDLVITPSVVLPLLCTVGLLLTLRRTALHCAKWCLVLGIGGLLAFAILPLGSWMMRPLEDRFSMPDPMPADVDGIVVLGGGISVDRSVDRNAPLLNDAGGRMTAFVALAHRYPRARLVFSGGNADPFVVKTSEAAIARSFFRGMGLGTRDIVYEAKSRNTYENALNTRRLVKPRPGERWLLVTSAVDMPRAVGCFRGVGWPVIAFPSDYHTLRGSSGFLPGLVHGLRQADWAMHEWMGLLYYRVRGWTPALFPGLVQ